MDLSRDIILQAWNIAFRLDEITENPDQNSDLESDDDAFLNQR